MSDNLKLARAIPGYRPPHITARRVPCPTLVLPGPFEPAGGNTPS